MTAPSAAGHDDPRVVAALERYLDDLEAGRAPGRVAFLADYPPDIAGPLGECLAGLEFLHAAACEPAEEEPPVPSHAPGRLGDFRLVREIGRGGMGVVYEAEQDGLGRRVAVKTLPASGGPAELRRFRHEARAAALLAHPNIVPVYAVGADSGVHYIAMRLIRGRSLAELIDRPRGDTTRPHAGPDTPAGDERPDPPAAPALPPDPRAAAQLAVQAADALAHAHAAGVVHRDVKPGNLLVDGRGHLWVTDFGLARLPGASRLTRTGALVGTLRYMAPEQVGPERGPADHRADLYALGATLYELLTRRPLVEGDDYWTVVPRILHRAPTPPRRLNPRVPRDLETVVLKLVEKEPANRYPTARDAADDLRRYLAGQPVRARRPGPVERAARWALRHRRAAAGAGLAAVALGVAQAAHQFQLAGERDAARDGRAQARAAVDDFYSHFAEQWLSLEPGAEPTQREFLLKAVAHYERLAEQGGGDPLAAATARRRAADASAKLGRFDEAAAGYALAAARLRELPGDGATRELAATLAARGNLLRTRGDLEAAGRDGRDAAAGFGALLAAGSADPSDRAGLAGVENNQGLIWRRLGRPAEALACFRAARSRFAALAAEFPGRPAFVGEAANCGHNLADTLAASGDDAPAEAAYREALALRRRACELAPGAPGPRRELARTQASLAGLVLTLGRSDEAGELAAASAAGREWLASAFPSVPAYRVEWASALRVAAEADAAGGRTADALARLDRAGELLGAVRDAPGAASEFARTRLEVGRLRAATDPAAAEAALREAVAASGGADPFDRQTRALATLALGRFLAASGRLIEAERALSSSPLSTLERGEGGVRLPLPHPPRPLSEAERGGLHGGAIPPDPQAATVWDAAAWAEVRAERGDVVRRLGRPAEAESLLRGAAAAATGDAPDHRQARAAALSGLARLAADRRDPEGAARLQSEAVAARAALLARADAPRRRADLAAARIDLAAWLPPAGAAEQARKALELLPRGRESFAASAEVRALRRRALEALPPTAKTRRELALLLGKDGAALAAEAARLAPGDWRNHAAVGITSVQAGKSPEADAAFARARQLRASDAAPPDGAAGAGEPEEWLRRLTDDATARPATEGTP